MENYNHNEEESVEYRTFSLEVNGEDVECTPDNTRAYLYTGENKKYNHVFIAIEEEVGEESVFGCFIWRDKDEEVFNELLVFLRDNGYRIDMSNQVPEVDIRAWQDAHDEELLEEMDEETVKQIEAAPEPIPELKELTPRQENRVQFLMYLLDKNKLIDEDFKGKGDLYL